MQANENYVVQMPNGAVIKAPHRPISEGWADYSQIQPKSVAMGYPEDNQERGCLSIQVLVKDGSGRCYKGFWWAESGDVSVQILGNVKKPEPTGIKSYDPNNWLDDIDGGNGGVQIYG